MQFEDYLEFVGPTMIYIKGTQIGLEHVLGRWQNGYSTDRIMHELPSLSLEQVNGAIAYYQQHKQEMDAYLKRMAELAEAKMQQAEAHPLPPPQQFRTKRTRS